MNHWINEEIEYLKNNYENLSLKELKNHFNRSENSIKLKAFRLNLTNKYLHWTNKKVEYLKNNYKNENKEELIKNLDHSWFAIQSKASILNLNRNTSLPINKDFLKNWNEEMAYIFGYWIADGNMGKNNYRISFVSKDFDFINMIKSLLKSKHKISKYDNVFRFAFCDKTIYSDLLKLGGTPRKSFTIQFPEVPDRFLPHFIRGEFDGDGCNYIYKNGVYRYLISSFTGNVDFLSTLKDKIKEHVGIETGKLYPDKRCNPRIRQLVYRGKKAITLCDYIYQDSENLRLERKFKKYDEMKKEYIKKLEEKD